MKTVNMHQAKSMLSALVRELRSGAEGEIVIAIDGVPAAKLVPLGQPSRRLLGIDRGLVHISDDFDGPNAEITKLFQGA
jgi:antitoxin (DNA-binding transcriptional repressor) of toxin-antitoxin stability system